MPKIQTQHDLPAKKAPLPGSFGIPGTHGGTTGTPTLGITDFGVGEAQPYAFLMQRPVVPPHENSDAPYGFLSVTLRAIDSQGNNVPLAIVRSEWDPTWTWEVREPDNEIRQNCVGKWYVQAACSDGLSGLRVKDAEDTWHTQQSVAGKKILFGEFMMQGFRTETIKSIAINWASNPPMLTGVGGIPDFQIFDLIGGQNPATINDRLQLDVNCEGFGHIVETYYPKIRLRVQSGE